MTMKGNLSVAADPQTFPNQSTPKRCTEPGQASQGDAPTPKGEIDLRKPKADSD